MAASESPREDGVPPVPRNADARVRDTERRLRAAFADLIATRPIGSLTVSELTRAAGVSRATFYRRHASVHAYVEELCESALAQFRAVLIWSGGADEPKFGTYEALANRLRALADVICSDVVTHRALWGPAGPPEFRDRVRRTLGALITEDLHRLGVEIDPTYCPIEYVAAFEANAIVGVLETWLSMAQRESVDDLAFFMLMLVQNGSDVMKATRG